MAIFSITGHILTELFGKTDDWQQIYKQTNSNIYDMIYIYNIYIIAEHNKCSDMANCSWIYSSRRVSF